MKKKFLVCDRFFDKSTFVCVVIVCVLHVFLSIASVH